MTHPDSWLNLLSTKPAPMPPLYSRKFVRGLRDYVRPEDRVPAAEPNPWFLVSAMLVVLSLVILAFMQSKDALEMELFACTGKEPVTLSDRLRWHAEAQE